MKAVYPIILSALLVTGCNPPVSPRTHEDELSSLTTLLHETAINYSILNRTKDTNVVLRVKRFAEELADKIDSLPEDIKNRGDLRRTRGYISGVWNY